MIHPAYPGGQPRGFSANAPLFDAHSRAKVPEMFWSGSPHVGLQIELNKPGLETLFKFGKRPQLTGKEIFFATFC